MHGTRTTAKILVGAAVAALAGCVSVDTPPTAPAPASAPAPAPVAETVRPGQGVAPQIVEGPAREALEAALPAPPPTAAPRATPSSEVRRGAVAPRTETRRPEAVPQQRERPRPAPRREFPEMPELPKPTGVPMRAPVSRADVCELGERYGGWAPGSDPSRICRGASGR
ncbi:hypothetical protein AB0M38_14855 [Streptomyces sp. NPDC051742]|uniref:hypothetical protein n=1 Tax=unclassified Streptomyces TaxID=2593676 RepID=UPI0034212EA0